MVFHIHSLYAIIIKFTNEPSAGWFLCGYTLSEECLLKLRNPMANLNEYCLVRASNRRHFNAHSDCCGKYFNCLAGCNVK